MSRLVSARRAASRLGPVLSVNGMEELVSKESPESALIHRGIRSDKGHGACGEQQIAAKHSGGGHVQRPQHLSAASGAQRAQDAVLGAHL